MRIVVWVALAVLTSLGGPVEATAAQPVTGSVGGPAGSAAGASETTAARPADPAARPADPAARPADPASLPGAAGQAVADVPPTSGSVAPSSTPAVDAAKPAPSGVAAKPGEKAPRLEIHDAPPPRQRPPAPDVPAPKPGTVLSERVANYTISVRLDPREKKLIGRETITWTNRSPDPVSEIQLHLYWNAFKNQRSTFLREVGGRALRSEVDPYEKDDWGYTDITAIRSEGVDLKSGLEFIHPDDDNADDQTVARVPLARPVAPGETVAFEVDFSARAPRVIARAGFYQNFFLIGQWFPKLGVLQYPGNGAEKTGWNCHQYHANSEFFADFGSYDVSITLPSEFKVAATGLRKDTRQNTDKTTTYRYQQDDVIDFAWTAWPDYLEVDSLFDEPGMPKVNIHMMMPPEMALSIEPTLQAMRDALKFYGESWFPYPYPQITVVIPPYNTYEAGGMEYPTFITTWGAIYPKDKDWALRGVTLHEFGHNYWQGMLASNEFEESWLDEGINSYGEGLAEEGRDVRLSVDIKPVLAYPIPLGGPALADFELYRGAVLQTFDSPILTTSWKFLDRGDYSVNSYPRTAVTLRTLQAYLGDDVMKDVMRTYARRFAFHHPTSQDFFSTASEVAGEDLSWFFDQFMKGTAALDYAITEVDADEQGFEQGYFDTKDGRQLIDEKAAEEARKQAEKAGGKAAGDKTATDKAGDKADEQAAADKADEKAAADKAADEKAAAPKAAGDKGYHKIWRNSVVATRKGEAWFPIAVKVIFDDGSVVIEHWGGRERWKRYIYQGTRKVVSAEVDPDHQLYLDKNWLNNGRTLKPDPLPPARLTAAVANLEQLILAFLSTLV